jgi:phage/plasmid primase-like uncharacterized protein
MNLLETKIFYHFNDGLNTWICEYTKAGVGWNVDIFKNNKSVITKAWVSERKGITMEGAKALIEVTAISLSNKFLKDRLR